MKKQKSPAVSNPKVDTPEEAHALTLPTLKLEHDFLIRPDVYKLILDSVDYVRKTRMPKVLVLLPRETSADGCDDVYMRSMYDDLQKVFKGMGDDIAFTCAFARNDKKEYSLAHIVVGIYDVNRMLEIPLNRLADNQPSFRVPILPSKVDELVEKLSAFHKQNKQNFVSTVACLTYDHLTKDGSISDDGMEAAEIHARGLKLLGTTTFSPFVYVNLLLNKDVIALYTTSLVK